MEIVYQDLKKELGCTSEYFKRLRFVITPRYINDTFDYKLLKGYWPK